MNLLRNNRQRFPRLTAGWCGLLFYIGACSPLGLGLAALIGSQDQSHQLRIGSGPQASQLVLHHGGSCAGHHHGLVARALTVFAKPTDPTAPDHILQFSSGHNLKSQSEISAPQPQSAVLFLTRGGNGFAACVPVDFESGASVHSPPDESAAQLCLRSTVLLI